MYLLLHTIFTTNWNEKIHEALAWVAVYALHTITGKEKSVDTKVL